MKKIKITRVKLIAFLTNAKSYIKSVGTATDKLSHACSNVLEHDGNIEIMTEHNLLLQKMRKKLGRDLRDAEVEFGKIEHGVLVKTADGNLQFSPADQIKVNAAVDVINDKYAEDIEKFGNESIEYYFPSAKVKDLPSTLLPEYRKALSLLID